AATFAVTCPIAFAFLAHSAGVAGMAKWAAIYLVLTGVGLTIVGKQIWPGIVAEYERRSIEKRRAIADLNCGFGEAAHLIHRRAPYCVEHDGGVLVFADAGDFKTLFFSIENSEDDPRWLYYQHGELNRKVWRWLRLPVSREIVRFSAQGTRTGNMPPPPRIPSVDAWEAIHLALDEPIDGAVISLPLADVIDAVERRL
ncbi:MAG: hypothetical protein K2Q06_13495, partial [Parvularculaceae bacterium]|nr:hypothetical protein [Parvularculaceae bacterium]